MRANGWQLAGTWLAGSVTTGTLTVILTDDATGPPFHPLDQLSAGALLGVLALAVALFLALFVLFWRTAAASWLPHDGRAAILWSVVVGCAGLFGSGFTAVVMFTAEVPLEFHLAVAYVVGGLPFALIAGMLARPPMVNAVAVATTIAALGIGYAIADDNELGATPLQLCVLYLQVLIGPTF